MVVARDWGGKKNGELLFSGYEISGLEGEKSSGDG